MKNGKGEQISVQRAAKVLLIAISALIEYFISLLQRNGTSARNVLRAELRRREQIATPQVAGSDPLIDTHQY